MLSQQIRNSASLLDSIDAIRNWRAALLLLATLVATALVFTLGGMLATVSFFLSLLFSLAAIGVSFYGANAVGMMVMDEAQGRPSRPAMAALMTSLATSHRLILVFLLLGLVYLVGFLALTLVLFLCKIPFLGPVLYAVVFPVSVVVVGIALFALPTVVFPLSAPSVWSGARTMECISQLLAIARKKLLLVLLLMVAVAFISGVVGFLIGAVLFSGMAVTMGLSMPILGGGAALGAMMGGPGMGMGVDGFGTGHTIAAALGGGVLFAVAFTLPGMVYLRGACTVYLRAVEDLDLAAEQAAMDEKLAAARAKAREMQEKAQAQAQKYAAPPPPPPPAPATPPAPAATQAPVAAPTPPASMASAAQAPSLPPTGPATLACPQCGAAVVPGDAFCGECGRKL